MRFDAIPIRRKIMTVIAAMAIVVVAGCVCAAIQMLAIRDSYSDIIERVDGSATLAARGNRLLAQYGYLAYKLAAQTTDEGNAQMLAALQASDAEYNHIQNKIRLNLPEYSAAISRVDSLAASALKACAGPIDFAGKSTKLADVTTAALRLRSECDPPLDSAIKAQRQLADILTEDAGKRSDELAQKTHSVTITMLRSLLAGLIIGAGLGAWLAAKEIAVLIMRFRNVVQSLAR